MARKPPASAPAPPAREGWEGVFDPDFLEDLHFFIGTNPRLAGRVIELVQAVLRDPFVGIGKPEPLRGRAAGAWSRRVDSEHRLVYQVADRRVFFVQCRYHYSK